MFIVKIDANYYGPFDTPAAASNWAIDGGRSGWSIICIIAVNR